ncbi:hypothetical protein LEMLEM_LOCUS17939 [Lemmus lemmus]
MYTICFKYHIFTERRDIVGWILKRLMVTQVLRLRGKKQGIIQQPEALPHTVMQQDISQVPLLLHWPTVIVPLNYVPANLNPQMMISFSWNPGQPVTIPCAS